MKKPGPTDRSQDQIEHNLRRAYGQILDEGVPPRFGELLARLRDGDGSARGDSAATNAGRTGRNGGDEQ